MSAEHGLAYRIRGNRLLLLSFLVAGGIILGPGLITDAHFNIRYIETAKVVNNLVRVGALWPDHQFAETGPEYLQEGGSAAQQPHAVNPVLAAWLAISGGRTTDAALALLQAADQHSGFTRSLDAVIQSEKAQRGRPLWSVPTGLPEYEYGLALRAADAQDWQRSLEHFQRALVYRPGPWPEEFYERYEQALTYVVPREMQRLTVEQSAAASTSPQVKVGRKDQSGWEIPVPIADAWTLQGFTVCGWQAIDWGLPLTIDLSWLDVAGRSERHIIRTWNMVPNAGFELSEEQNPASIPGWLQSSESSQVFLMPLWRRVWHDGYSSTALVLSPSVFGRDDSRFTRLLKVTPQTFLLWSAWIESISGGNPHIFVHWFDARGKAVRTEIPMQGNASGVGKVYAGVMQVPAQADYVQITLQNWQARGEVLWDNLLLVSLQPPTRS